MIEPMMGYKLQISGKYKKDYCHCTERHWKLEDLDDVVKKLCRGECLGREYHDHPLSGKWKGCREWRRKLILHRKW